MYSDMELLLDMMPAENIVYENVEPGKTNEYYQGHAECILKQLDTVEHYYHFVTTILKNYHILNNEQQKMIQDRLNIKSTIVEKTVIKEKIIYRDNKKKPMITTYDDY